MTEETRVETAIATELLAVSAEFTRSQEMHADIDPGNTVNDFAAFITRYTGDAVFASDSGERYRALIKVANLAATAAMIERAHGGLALRHYDPQS